MSKASNYVKAWRKNSKKRIIESMGGSCVICGYNKGQSGLALHHLDPKSKDFGLGAVRANIKSWNKIAEELKKCILVCHNCHSEIHENLIKIPSDVKRFNENFIEYKKIKTSLCKMCKLKSHTLSNTLMLWCRLRLAANEFGLCVRAAKPNVHSHR